jgi:hypothetical protein
MENGELLMVNEELKIENCDMEGWLKGRMVEWLNGKMVF